MKQNRILFVAGDPSGDAHAAAVAQRLKTMDPSVRIIALGGHALQKVADPFLGNLVKDGVMGFWEPLRKLPRYWHFFYRVLKPALEEWRPDVVVPVDFFGFNRFTIQLAKQKGHCVVYFISPQVWASRPGRVSVLKKYVNRMMVIFPFEEKIYRDAGIPVTFVGHPLMDTLPLVTPGQKPAKVEPVIGLLPGSREREVTRHLPLFLQAADQMARETLGLRFVLFASPALSNDFYDRLIPPHLRVKTRERPYILEIVRDEDYTWRTGLDLAITTSGTATLENALLGIPMVVTYRTSWITYALARAMIRVPYISMANILAGRKVVPELIQLDANPDRIARECLALTKDVPRRRLLEKSLHGLRREMGKPGATQRAADVIRSFLPLVTESDRRTALASS